MNCRESSQLLSEARERELRADERRELDAHLSICPACRNCERHFEWLPVLLRRALLG
jgi:anti-sigma factor RsiW